MKSNDKTIRLKQATVTIVDDAGPEWALLIRGTRETPPPRPAKRQRRKEGRA
jgi:hypothetical protein